MSTMPSADPGSAPGGSGSALRIIGRIVTIVIVVISVLAVKAVSKNDPAASFVIGLVCLALLGLRYAIPAFVRELRGDKPSVPLALGKLLLGVFGAMIALFSVSAVWNDGTIVDLPVGMVRFGYLGGATAFTSGALLGLSLCGMLSAVMNFAGIRLGWLRGMAVLIAITVAGGLLAPIASGRHYRQLEAQKWQQVAGSTDSFEWSGYEVDVPEPFQRPERRAGYTWAYVNEGLHGNTELLRNTLNDMRLTKAEAAVPDWERIFKAILEWLPKAPNPKASSDIAQALVGAIDRNPFPPSIVALKELAKKDAAPPSQ
jgi:hypothetical protein